MPAPDVPGLIAADQIRTTAAHIADWQLPSGMIPWFPGGHADPCPKFCNFLLVRCGYIYFF